MNNNIFLELKESDATLNRGSGSWVRDRKSVV